MHDYIIIGGGLQGGLLTLAIRHQQPEASVLLIERDSRVGGNHTWSFHPKDVPAEAKSWIEPLVSSRWPNYRVRFPAYERHVDLPYATISSEHFAAVIEESFGPIPASIYQAACANAYYSGSGGTDTLQSPANVANGEKAWPLAHSGSCLMTDTDIEFISANSVRTRDGETFEGKVVIDCRGPRLIPGHASNDGGFQKFFGFEIELDGDWPEPYPVVMDACGDQSIGFRFIYSLPFSSRRVLVEDTQFSDDSSLDRDECLRNVEAFVAKKTNKTWSIVREESGCLPMPMTHSTIPRASYPLQGGYAGGWFHAATGYSFPLAVRFAQTVASVDPERAVEAIACLAQENQSQAKFARLLNRLLFHLIRPNKRWTIFHRFYRVLSDERISRFYAHRFTKSDAFKIVIGRPPAGLTPLHFIHSFLERR